MDTESLVRVFVRIQHSNLCRKTCIRSSQIAMSFTSVVIVSLSTFGKRNAIKKETFYLHHFVLETKAEDLRLRRTAFGNCLVRFKKKSQSTFYDG